MCAAQFLNIYPPLKAMWHSDDLLSFFSAGLFLNSSLFHAYCAQRMEKRVFVLDGSTTLKKWVTELSGCKQSRPPFFYQKFSEGRSEVLRRFNLVRRTFKNRMGLVLSLRPLEQSLIAWLQGTKKGVED